MKVQDLYETVSEVNIMRKMDTMRKVGDDGLTGIQRAGMKTKESHLANVDEYGMNGYQQQKLIQFMNGNGIKASNQKDRQSNYNELIAYITYKSDFREEIIGTNNVIMTRDSGDIKRDIQVDHIYSRSNGYLTGQSPFMIGDPLNCRIVTIHENQQKANRSDITLKDLYQITGYTRERSEYEYQLFLEAAEQSYKVGNAYSNLFVMVHMYEKYNFQTSVVDFREKVKEVIKSNGNRYT